MKDKLNTYCIYNLYEQDGGYTALYKKQPKLGILVFPFSQDACG